LVYLIYDDKERLIDGHQKKDNLIRHSEQSEESHTFNEFLTQRIQTFVLHIYIKKILGQLF
jgi:hypothetical protein